MQVPGSVLETSALRLVFAPGVGESFRLVSNTAYGYRQDLRSGSYKDKIGTDFLWSGGVSSSNSSTNNGTGVTQRMSGWTKQYGGRSYRLRKRLGAHATAGRREGDILGGNATISLDPSKSTRAQQWITRLEPVLNGSITCNFRGLTYAIEKPYLRIGRINTLYNPQNTTAINGYNNLDQAASCLTALIAYLVSDASVFYLEEFPRVQITDQVANGILESGISTSFPISIRGLDGTGQVIQIADTGLDMQHCLFRDNTGNVRTTTYDVAAFDSSRRKVIQYVVWADSADLPSGHGTHVNGKDG